MARVHWLREGISRTIPNIQFQTAWRRTAITSTNEAYHWERLEWRAVDERSRFTVDDRCWSFATSSPLTWEPLSCLVFEPLLTISQSRLDNIGSRCVVGSSDSARSEKTGMTDGPCWIRPSPDRTGSAAAQYYASTLSINAAERSGGMRLEGCVTYGISWLGRWVLLLL